MSAVVTVTLNPSLDRTLRVERLHRGGVVRAAASTLEPGGKGVNVARALVAHDVPAVAVLPSGGAAGAALVELLRAEGVAVEVVPVGGETRSNVALVEADGTTTKVNEPGPALRPEELDVVLKTAARRAADASWVVAGGNLPPGAPPDAYATLARLVADEGAGFVLDTSGDPLLHGLAGRPALAKPNLHELADVVGLLPRTLGEAVDAAHAVRGHGVAAVLASLGPDGALLVTRHGVLHGELSGVVVRGTVGAGDALLAGFLAAGGTAAGTDPRAALAEGLAWAAAALATEGTGVPRHPDRAAVVLHPTPHLDRELRETS